MRNFITKHILNVELKVDTLVRGCSLQDANMIIWEPAMIKLMTRPSNYSPINGKMANKMRNLQFGCFVESKIVQWVFCGRKLFS